MAWFCSAALQRQNLWVSNRLRVVPCWRQRILRFLWNFNSLIAAKAWCSAYYEKDGSDNTKNKNAPSQVLSGGSWGTGLAHSYRWEPGKSDSLLQLFQPAIDIFVVPKSEKEREKERELHIVSAQLQALFCSLSKLIVTASAYYKLPVVWKQGSQKHWIGDFSFNYQPLQKCLSYL